MTPTFSLAATLPAGASALAIPVTPGPDRPVAGAGADVVAALGIDVDRALARDEAKGEPGEVVTVPADRDGVETVLLVGVGDASPAALRKAAAAMVRRAKKSESLATTLATGRGADAVRAVVEGAGLASYVFSRKSAPKPPKPARVLVVATGPGDALDRAVATVAAVRLARDLANTPSLEKSPAWLADQAAGVAARSGLQAEVWDDDRLRADGFGGIVAVGRGSVRPPRLVRLTHAPRGATRRVALVGKGITFDSGGLSLKRGDGMATMKTDMSGAAAVIAAMSALSRLDVPLHVTGLVPLAENMPGGDATRPSDVIRHYGGRTSEVLNTDAEGRLVLADALSYAVKHLSPDAVVDLATLTGAATLGLGKRHGALFATSTTLRDALTAAGAAGGERLWPMPLVDDYRDALDSPVADLRNVAEPSKHYSGGAIIAALFLGEFVGPRLPWAHLDIAGPARADADEDDVTKGATGFGTRTLLRWLEAGAAA